MNAESPHWADRPIPSRPFATRLWIALAAAALVGLLLFALAAAGLALLAMQLYLAVLNNVVRELPAAIEEHVRDVTAAITEIDVPRPFEPGIGLWLELHERDAEFPLTAAAAYVIPDEDAEPDARSFLVIAEFKEVAECGRFEADIRDRFHPSVEDELLAKEVASIERRIRDEPATFNIFREQDLPDAPGGHFLVLGTFRGNNGPAVLAIRVSAEWMDQQSIVEVIDSIR